MNDNYQLLSVQVGTVQPLPVDTSSIMTGIQKQAVAGKVVVNKGDLGVIRAQRGRALFRSYRPRQGRHRSALRRTW